MLAAALAVLAIAQASPPAAASPGQAQASPPAAASPGQAQASPPAAASPGQAQTSPPAAASPGPAQAPDAEKKQEDLFEEVAAWVNDDVVLWGELREQEQADLQQLLADKKKPPPDELARRAKEVRERVLFELITGRLLVQEAERLYDMDVVKKDVLKRFREQKKIKTDEELDEMLLQWGMTRDELEDKLVMSSVPEYVVDMQVMRNLGVPELEARRYYEENKARFTSPAQVSFREIVLMTSDPAVRAGRREEAEKIVARARGGEDFIALVKEKSEAPSRALDGLIGPVQPTDLAEQIAQVVLEVSVGQVSNAVETPAGWHIIKVEDRRDAVVPTFESVRKECEQAVRVAQSGPAYDAYIKKIWKAATIEVRRGYVERLPAPWRELVTVKD